MVTLKHAFRAALSLVVLVFSLSTIASSSAWADEASIAAGKKIAFDRKKGNCLACHLMDNGALPGNIGPPLIAMAARFPDRKALRDQIFDPTAKNPNTIMPPFGKHGILTAEEIEKVTDYVHSL